MGCFATPHNMGMRRPSRAIASALAMTLAARSGGPVWAQTARVTIQAATGMSGVPVLPQNGMGAIGFSNAPSLSPSLSALAPLPSPSATAAAQALVAAPVVAAAPVAITPLPAVRAAAKPAVLPTTVKPIIAAPLNSYAALRAMHLPAASGGEKKGD